MKLSSTITAAALFAVTLFTLTASAGYAGTIRLGMTPEPYMPFTQINQAGIWEGFEADLTQAVFEKMGIEHKISQMAWEGLIPSLTANKVDFIIGAFSITEERRKVVDYEVKHEAPANAILGEGIGYAVRKGDTATLDKIDAALAALEKDGSLDTMVQKWFPSK